MRLVLMRIQSGHLAMSPLTQAEVYTSAQHRLKVIARFIFHYLTCGQRGRKEADSMEEKQTKMNTDWAGLFGEGATIIAGTGDFSAEADQAEEQ